MKSNYNLTKICKQYLERFAYYQNKLIQQAPKTNTSLIVVIPCYNEPNLLVTFQSLAENIPTQNPVEIITVINQAKNSNQEIQLRNEQTFQEAKKWIQEESFEKLSFQLIYERALPKKHAGVGLARKIGMDEALRRFQTLDINGGIVCLDADCQVEQNYLINVEKKFQESRAKTLSIYFKHQLNQNEELNKGIIYYELFLRYYVQALKFTGFPNSFHTVGSSMAVRADAYALGGGMNRRKAGEDFYFMHKMALMGGHEALNKTCVYPSARISERVPFGTGKAQQKWLEQNSEDFMTYNFDIFKVLKAFLEQVPQFYESPEHCYQKIPNEIQAFVPESEFTQKILEIKTQTKEYITFYKRFFTWWDGLKILQCVHFLRDNFYLNQNIIDATNSLLQHIELPYKVQLLTPFDRLILFQKLDKEEKV